MTDLHALQDFFSDMPVDTTHFPVEYHDQIMNSLIQMQFDAMQSQIDALQKQVDALTKRLDELSGDHK